MTRKIWVSAAIVLIPLALLVIANRPMQEMPSKAVWTPGGAYVHTEQLFMLRPPPGWVATERFPPEMAVTAVVSFELRDPGSWFQRVWSRTTSMGGIHQMAGNARANVMVRVWRWRTTIDRILALMKSPTRALVYGIKSEGPTTLGGLPAYRLHYSWGPFHQLEAGEHVEYYVTKGDKVYLVSYMTFKKVPFETYYQEADAAIKSFQFLEKLTLDVENGTVVVDGTRYARFPTTLYLSLGERHTLVAEPVKPFWPWAGPNGTFAGWNDGHPSPSRQITLTKSEAFTARFR